MKINLYTKIIWIAIVACLISLLFKPIKPVSLTAQNEITILREAKQAIDSLPGAYNVPEYDKAELLGILAIAEQLKRIADALERR